MRSLISGQHRLHAEFVPGPERRSIWAPRYWPTWLLIALAWLIAKLPYTTLLLLGRALGSASFRLSRKRWRRAASQMQLCLPELSAAGHRRLIRTNAQSYGIGVMERLIGWWWPAQRSARLLNSVSGLEHLQQGRGVLLVALHTTTMDIAATLLRLLTEIDFTYQAADNPVIDWVQRRGRSRPEIAPEHREQAATAAIEASSVRTMIRRLRAGRVVWYAPDRDFGVAKSHVFAPLFGMPAATITATSRYARLTGASVITLHYWRDAQGGYSLRFAPLQGLPSDSEIDDCARINAWIESAVRLHPEQYRWTHMRFRTRPQTISEGAVPLSSTAEAANSSVAPPATSRATAA